MIYRCIKSNAIPPQSQMKYKNSFIIFEREMTVRNRGIVDSAIELKK